MALLGTNIHTLSSNVISGNNNLGGYEGISFTFSDASVSRLDAVLLRSPQESTIAQTGPS